MNDCLLMLAKRSLLGVSIGDAFGDSFFGETDFIEKSIIERAMPETRWDFTDDTVMSIAVLDELEHSNGNINQDSLVKRFCINHNLDINRGYGATVRRLLREVNEGKSWKELSAAAFDGHGSMGNGAAMRVCPIGAYHYMDWHMVKQQAAKSAEVTHYNIEAVTGAMAVALATAQATFLKQTKETIEPTAFIKKIIAELPSCDTTARIATSLTVPYTYHIETVKKILGNGINMTAQDTVPFAIWCAAHNLTNFEEALWKAVSILGDRDTICAIVGGITIMSCSEETIPVQWIEKVENYEASIFRASNNIT